jgi:hypothetical protein
MILGGGKKFPNGKLSPNLVTLNLTSFPAEPVVLAGVRRSSGHRRRSLRKIRRQIVLSNSNLPNVKKCQLPNRRHQNVNFQIADRQKMSTSKLPSSKYQLPNC